MHRSGLGSAGEKMKKTEEARDRRRRARSERSRNFFSRPRAVRNDLCSGRGEVDNS